MPFIPHTADDVQAMLAAIGVPEIASLFDEIPASLRWTRVEGVPPGLPEMAISRLMRERAARDAADLCFLGAGAYEHHIPAAVWEIATRGEFYSAYTPYQAEASQGTLQLIYEYQSMMTALMAMDVSNASLYDGASALAEAVLMALRANRRNDARRVWMPAAVHPHYRETVRTIVEGQGIDLIEVPYDPATGVTLAESLDALPDAAALVVPQPNFFGRLEEVDALTDAARARGALVIALVNPLAMAILKPPGHWGDGACNGADIACGEGQPLGVPLAGGGPYYGFLCCRRSMPADARADRGADRRSRRSLGIHPYPATARTAHPACQGDLQHLHQPGPDGDGLHHPHGTAGRRGTGPRRPHRPCACPRAGDPAGRLAGGHTTVRRTVVP